MTTNGRPSILPENEVSRAHRAFLHFEGYLMDFEEAMKPIHDLLSVEACFELQMVGVTARSFFTMANQELFSQQAPAVPATQENEKTR